MASANPTGPATPGRRARRKAETRRRILRAAARLFAGRGFDATTIDEIAQAADVSRGTFFNYYAEKSALIAELGDRMTDEFLGHMREAQALDAPVGRRLSAAFARSGRRLLERPDLTRAILRETVTLRRGLDDCRAHTLHFHRGFEIFLEDGVVRGDVRSDVLLSLLAEVLSGAYVEILVTWLIEPDYPLLARLDAAADVLGVAVQATARPTR